MIPIFKGIIKYGLPALIVSYLTFQHADRLQNLINALKYTFVESEQGFVKKEQALDMRIRYERNDKNALETYLKTYNQKLPVYARENGIMVGDAFYIFSNLTKEERMDVCNNTQHEKKKVVKKTDRLKKLLYDIYKNIGDEKNEE